MYISATICTKPWIGGLGNQRMSAGVLRRPQASLGRPWGVLGSIWDLLRVSGTSFGSRASSTEARNSLWDSIGNEFWCILRHFGVQKHAPIRYYGHSDASSVPGSILRLLSWLAGPCSCSRAFWRRGLGHCDLRYKTHIRNVHIHRVRGDSASDSAYDLRTEFVGFVCKK